jgi:hypothetical protein
LTKAKERGDRARARRHDDRRAGVARRYSAVDVLAVMRTSAVNKVTGPSIRSSKRLLPWLELCPGIALGPPGAANSTLPRPQLFSARR